MLEFFLLLSLGHCLVGRFRRGRTICIGLVFLYGLGRDLQVHRLVPSLFLPATRFVRHPGHATRHFSGSTHQQLESHASSHCRILLG